MGDEGVDFDMCFIPSFKLLSSVAGEVVDILRKNENVFDCLKLWQQYPKCCEELFCFRNRRSSQIKYLV